MTLLQRGGEVLGPVEVASAPIEVLRGLLGRHGVEGALLLPGCSSVHTLGMRFAIDVAFLDRRGRVVSLVTPMRPWRVGRARWRAREVLEAEAGTFALWGLAVGDMLRVVNDDDTELVAEMASARLDRQQAP